MAFSSWWSWSKSCAHTVPMVAMQSSLSVDSWCKFVCTAPAIGLNVPTVRQSEGERLC
jgi:hypothetical protein